MRTLIALSLIFCLSSTIVLATPTSITVRVISKDAKFVGSGVGGVSVMLRNADNGDLLAEGIIEGGTGDTKRIMLEPRQRHRPVSTEDAAAYTTSIDIDSPMRVEVVARGPLANPDSANTVSATQWVIPGKHITGGDAWLMEMPGFSVSATVEIKSMPADGDVTRLSINAKVTMMCGCPIEPDGLWDANRLQVAVMLTDGKGTMTEFPLTYAGTTSLFSGSAELPGRGPYTATVYAYDPNNGNTGADIVQFNEPR